MSSSSPPLLGAEALERSLSLRDLTDPEQGPHALQLLVREVSAALERAWRCRVTVHRAPRLVSVDDNYDALHYPAGGAARDARYTRYASPHTVLRSQMSAAVPALLRDRAPRLRHDDELLVLPGLVYRRDCVDRLHVGEPHQLDLWRLSRRARLGETDLRELIELVVAALLPGRRAALTPTTHPYTEHGLQLDVEGGAGPVEIGECGLAHPGVLARAGVDPGAVTGLAMGLGLDRILMLRKGLDDIRLLRSPQAASQLLDLEPYRPPPRLPPVRRDLSLVVAAERTIEELGDRLRTALGEDAEVVEELAVLARTAAVDLPPQALRRLGIDLAEAPRLENLLLRVVLRPLERTLTDQQANALRDRVYAALHEGRVMEWSAYQR